MAEFNSGKNGKTRCELLWAKGFCSYRVEHGDGAKESPFAIDDKPLTHAEALAEINRRLEAGETYW